MPIKDNYLFYRAEPEDTAGPIAQAAHKMSLDPSVGHIPIPQTYAEALASPHAEQWQAAIDSEAQSLTDHSTFRGIVKLPQGAKTLGCRWVFKVKYRPVEGPDGQTRLEIERFKARLTCKGFRQRPGIDFIETFAPVIRTDILRLLLSLVVELDDMEIHQMDVRTAFLEPHLKEEIYLKTPPGIKIDTPFVKLLRTLYGLKQAPREFHDLMQSHLIANGYTKVPSCNCLYFKRVDGQLCLIGIYVDDCIIAGPSQLIAEAKQTLLARFDMQDLGELKYVLGFEV